jgi:hypothetical protein
MHVKFNVSLTSSGTLALIFPLVISAVITGMQDYWDVTGNWVVTNDYHKSHSSKVYDARIHHRNGFHDCHLEVQYGDSPDLQQTGGQHLIIV